MSSSVSVSTPEVTPGPIQNTQITELVKQWEDGLDWDVVHDENYMAQKQWELSGILMAVEKNQSTVTSIVNNTIQYIEQKMPIHEAVVAKVAQQTLGVTARIDTGIPGAGRNGGYGYPDVVSGNFVWEIKPDTLYGHTTGPKQMVNYTAGEDKVPGYPVEIEPFEFNNGTVTVTCGLPGTKDAGVVYYQYTKHDVLRTQPSYSLDQNTLLKGALTLLAIGIGLLIPGPFDEALAFTALGL